MREPPVQQLRLQKGRRVTAHRPQEVEAGVREPPSPRENHLPPLHSPREERDHPQTTNASKLSCLRGRGWGWRWMGVLRDDDESHNLWTKKHFFCLLKVLVILPKGIPPPSKAKAGRLCFLKHVTLTPPWQLRG